MIILRCDKCGKEEELSGTFPMVFERPDGKPKFVITHSSKEDPLKMINLCASCEEQLEEFLGLNSNSKE